MTVPGFPDFQDMPTWRGLPLVSGNPVTVPAGGQTFGPVAVGNFAGIHVDAFSQTQALTLTVSFFADAAGTFAVTAIGFPLPTAMSLDVVIPCAGDFYSVTVQPAGAGPVTLSLYVTATNLAGGRYQFLSPNPELLLDLTVQAAGLTSQFQLPVFCSGEAWVSVDPVDTTMNLQFLVETVTVTGATNHRLANFGKPASTATALLVLPVAPVALKVVNSDAVNPHSFRASIVPRVAA